MRKKKVPKGTVLLDSMRFAYVDFAELLLKKVQVENPKNPKVQQLLRETIDDLLDKEFGENTGRLICLD